jgi:hypothetical protein
MAAMASEIQNNWRQLDMGHLLIRVVSSSYRLSAVFSLSAGETAEKAGDSL